MTISQTSSHALMPYKSVAVALLFSVILGPVGLLYASFWGGLTMITLGVVFICGKFYFLTSVVWLMSCIWSVRSVESYNKKIIHASLQKSV